MAGDGLDQGQGKLCVHACPPVAQTCDERKQRCDSANCTFAQTALNIGSFSRSFCLTCRPETAHTRHAAVSAPTVGVCKGRRGPMARIVGGCGPCVRRKAARPRWFVRGTSAPARLKTTASSLTCRCGMAESTAENRRFSGYDRPGPSRESHPRCLRGGVAWLRRVVCKHLPTPPRKIKKQALKVTTRQ